MNIKEEKKLKILKLNKKLKTKLDIDLINYKIIKGKYILGSPNGKVKEYNCFDDKLIFEGEYLDGKRNGIGKEYENNKIIFEGKYLDGIRNGKGKEYFYNGKIKFEGIYFFGLKWHGKGYNKKGEIIYELNLGNGYIYELDLFGNMLYEGFYLNGKGKEYFNNKSSRFEGNYVNGINGMELDLIEIIILFMN